MRSSLARPLLHLLASALVGLVLSGCGNSDGNDGANASSLGACGLHAQITGGTSIDFSGRDDAACATLHSFDAGLDAVFIGTDTKGTLELAVRAVTEGETGSDYATHVLVTSTAKEHWQSDGCLTSITEHRLLSKEQSSLGELRHYQVTGDGTCSAPLDSVPAGGEPASVGPYAFRAEFTWRD
jgi:hypothetical protein